MLPLWPVTTHPNAALVTQQARNAAGDFVDDALDLRLLVRDRNTKYVTSFDEVFRAGGAESSEPHSGLRTPTHTRNGS